MTSEARIALARKLCAAVVSERGGMTLSRAWALTKDAELSHFWLVAAENIDRAVGPVEVKRRRNKLAMKPGAPPKTPPK